LNKISDINLGPNNEKKEIPGTGGKYFVCSNGDVYGPKGKLKPTAMKIGYLSVALSISKGIVPRKYVHKLVADNFLQNKNRGLVVNHIDGNKHNNSIENLEFINRKKNGSEWVKSRIRVNPREGKQSDYCQFGHKFKLTSSNNKYCPECRKLSTDEKLKLMNVDISQFVPIKNAENYLVANDGRVVGLKYPRLLKAGTNIPGYKYYNIKYDDNVRKSKAVHRLVYEHFIGDIPDGLSIDHIDGDKFNNHFKNLRTISPSENIRAWQDKKREAGKFGFKYTEPFISQAKWLIKSKIISQTESARRLSISQSFASDLFNDLKWKHVSPSKPSEEIFKVFIERKLSQIEITSMSELLSNLQKY
jgi:hypothetical protein